LGLSRFYERCWACRVLVQGIESIRSPSSRRKPDFESTGFGEARSRYATLGRSSGLPINLCRDHPCQSRLGRRVGRLSYRPIFNKEEQGRLSDPQARRLRPAPASLSLTTTPHYLTRGSRYNARNVHNALSSSLRILQLEVKFKSDRSRKVTREHRN